MDQFSLDSYDYNLPKDYIAKHPAHPRTSAKMLVFDRSNGSVTHSSVSKINDFLLSNCSIIMNDTKVIKARVFGKKENGRSIELLYIRDLSAYKHEVLIRGKVKNSDIIYFDLDLSAKIIKLNEDGSRIIEMYQNGSLLTFADIAMVLDKIGHIPLPPYMDRDDTEEDLVDYQSSFALNAGSVAAPTASLHFDENLINTIKNNHNSAFITLHIGLGTFKNVDANDIREHQIHSERYSISEQAKEIIDSSSDILCIGTTACRSVEYYFSTKKTHGECNIFLHPGNKPSRVNHLLTNFHLPKSTLIMLVSSMIGIEKTLELYQIAIKENYRFFSFGDAMLII